MSDAWMKEMSKFMSRPGATPGLMAFDPVQHAEVSTEDIKAMSDTDLVKLLNGEGNVDGFVGLDLRLAIMTEIGSRSTERAAKPNWAAIVGLVVAVVSLLATCLAWLGPLGGP